MFLPRLGGECELLTGERGVLIGLLIRMDASPLSHQPEAGQQLQGCSLQMTKGMRMATWWLAEIAHYGLQR